MWKHGNTSGKTSRISRTTGMSLSSREDLSLQRKWYGLESFGMSLTLWPEKVRLNYGLGNTMKKTLLSDRLTNHAKSDAKDLGFQSNTIYYGSWMATTICIPNIPSMNSSEKGWTKMCKSITSSRKLWGLAQPLGIKECDTLRWNRAEAA
jgi:hypothetical protein